jgi:Zn-dependent protease
MYNNPIMSLNLTPDSPLFRLPGGWLITLVTWVIPFLAIVVAITIHEFAHAFAADRLGDPNPRLQKRLTLNPLRHLDFLGTVMLIFFHFGWGKPVQFDPYNLKSPRKDAALIAAAGPLSNLFTAFLCGLGLYLLTAFTALATTPISLLYLFLYSLLSISVILAIFNLIPVFPLDGNHIISAFLSPATAHSFNHSMKRVGPILLIILILPIFSGLSLITIFLTPISGYLIQLFAP